MAAELRSQNDEFSTFTYWILGLTDTKVVATLLLIHQKTL